MSDTPIPYFKAPEALRARIESSIREAAAPATIVSSRRGSAASRSSNRLVGPLIGLAAAAILTVVVWRTESAARADDVELSAIVDSHLRSLSPGHLADVASTDQHTVKPWFAGKLNFSPPVTDFAHDGFPLVGGRLDVLRGEPAAALVYSRRGHLINVFVQPRGASDVTHNVSDERLGYHILRWITPETRYVAVSDLNVAELQLLQSLILRGSSSATTMDSASSQR